MGVFNAVMALSGMIDTDVIEQEKLARHTSYRIGGKADLFVTCHSYHSLRRTIEILARERVPWVIIGKGSNLLVADEGYRGAVITLGSEFSRFVLGEDGRTVTVGAGAILARLVNEALSKELSGLKASFTKRAKICLLYTSCGPPNTMLQALGRTSRG